MHEKTGNDPNVPVRWKRALPGVAICLLLSGCSLTGTWRTVAVSPESEPPPFSVVTFGRDHYTATTAHNGNPVTSTGTYTWNGRRLTTVPNDGPRCVYQGRRRMDRKLVLVHGRGSQKTTTTLERARDTSKLVHQ